MDDIRKWITTEIDYCVDHITHMAYNRNAELADVCTASVNDLPKFINSSSSSVQEILKDRLAGNEVLNLEPILQVLYDSSFKSDEYKRIGENDGMLHILAKLANKFEMTSEADRAHEAMYSVD